MIALLVLALAAVAYTRLQGPPGEPGPVGTGHEGPAAGTGQRTAEQLAAEQPAAEQPVGGRAAPDQAVGQPVPPATGQPVLPAGQPTPPAGQPAEDTPRPSGSLRQQVATVPDRPMPPPPATSEAPTLPNALTLAGGVVTLAYPAALALATGSEPVPPMATIPPCDEGYDYCFYLPPGAFEGTNFRAAGMAVARRPELSAQVSCLLAQPDGYSDLQPGLEVPQGDDVLPSTARFGDLGEGAAGTYSHGEVRRLFAAGVCYEFTLRVVEAQLANFPAGTVSEFTEAQRQSVLDELADVLGSATVAQEGTVSAVEWPAEGSSDLGPFIRLDEPEPGALVTSPIRLTGQAVGAWYFEGSFPVSLLGEGGARLGVGVATAQGDWMVTGMVPFVGEVEFAAPAGSVGEAGAAANAGQAGGTASAPTAPATLVLARDNPSDLPEHDAALHVGVVVAVEAGE